LIRALAQLAGSCLSLNQVWSKGPTRRPRAHHRVNPYLGARRQNETKMFQSIVAVTVGYSAEDSVHQGIFSQEAEAELDIRRWLGHRESVLGCVAGSVCPGSALRHSQRSHDANQVLTIWRNV